jgi:N-glycosylase/DNA lyase
MEEAGSLSLLQASYLAKQSAIRARLNEFAAIGTSATDVQLFEELVYCLFTAGASARMGLKSVERVRTLLPQGTIEQISSALIGAHRFPNARAAYIIEARNFLQRDCQLKLRQKLNSFGDNAEARRDFLVTQIKGIGYKEASHYLRNIGFFGYAILDKHILKTLFEYGVITSPQPPTTKKKYVATEEVMRNFAEGIRIDFDELDLLLWSNKTGEILK